MIIVVLRPFTCPVMNFITVMNVNRDPCVDYWVIRNPNVCCLKSSINDINLNVEISFIFYNVIQICYINHTISYFQIFHSMYAFCNPTFKEKRFVFKLEKSISHIGWLSITLQKSSYSIILDLL